MATYQVAILTEMKPEIFGELFLFLVTPNCERVAVRRHGYYKEKSGMRNDFQCSM